jgi:hypothetical protein
MAIAFEPVASYRSAVVPEIGPGFRLSTTAQLDF